MKKIPISSKSIDFLIIYLLLSIVLGFLLSGIIDNQGKQCHFCALADAFSHKTVFIENYIFKYQVNLDFIILKNHLVLHFPPLPAILIMPFVGNYIFGIKLLAIITVLASIYLTYLLIKRLSSLSRTNNLIILAGIILGTSFIETVLCSSTTWKFAEIIQYLLCISAILLVTAKDKKSPIIVGALIGLAFLTRFTAVFYLIFFIGWYWFEKKSKKDIWQFVLGFLPAVIIFLIYNFLRFDNSFTTGADKVINGIPELMQAKEEGFLSIRHIPENFYWIFLRGFQPVFGNNIFDLKFPYFHVAPQWAGLGLLFSSPFLFWIVKAPWRKHLLTLLSFIIIIVFVSFFLIYYFHGVERVGWRYLLDFLPFIVIVLVQSLNHEKKLSKFFLLLLVYSILLFITEILIKYFEF